MSVLSIVLLQKYESIIIRLIRIRQTQPYLTSANMNTCIGSSAECHGSRELQANLHNNRVNAIQSSSDLCRLCAVRIINKQTEVSVAHDLIATIEYASTDVLVSLESTIKRYSHLIVVNMGTIVLAIYNVRNVLYRSIAALELVDCSDFMLLSSVIIARIKVIICISISKGNLLAILVTISVSYRVHCYTCYSVSDDKVATGISINQVTIQRGRSTCQIQIRINIVNVAGSIPMRSAIESDIKRVAPAIQSTCVRSDISHENVTTVRIGIL